VALTDNITVTFHEPANEEIIISTERDTQRIASAVRDTVAEFNALREAAAQATRESGTQADGAETLRRRLDNIYYDNAEPLREAGITREADGNLRIDAGALSAAIGNGAAEALFSGPAGFGGQLQRLGETIVNDPVHFAMQVDLTII
jgi:flagellar capping protein FliD